MTERDLTLKQQLFIEAYLGDTNGNATEAARRAGYSGSDDTLRQIASENLTKPAIAARIAQRVATAAITADECLAILAEIARRDDREFIQVRTDARGNVVEARINLADKIRATELLGKHLKLFTDKMEVSTVQKAIIGIDLDRM